MVSLQKCVAVRRIRPKGPGRKNTAAFNVDVVLLLCFFCLFFFPGIHEKNIRNLFVSTQISRVERLPRILFSSCVKNICMEYLLSTPTIGISLF